MRYDDLPERLQVLICGKVTEHEDGSISVDGSVHWYAMGLDRIPIKFRKVTGDFDCNLNRLTNLENAPDWVGGSFWCQRNRLTSLDGLGEVQGDVFIDSSYVDNLELKDLLAKYRQKRAKKELT